MSEKMDEKNFSAFERHTQTALVLILVALLLWVGNTTQNTAVTVAEMRVEVAYLKASLEAPVPEVNEMSKRVDSLQLRIEQMERELQSLRQ